MYSPKFIHHQKGHEGTRRFESCKDFLSWSFVSLVVVVMISLQGSDVQLCSALADCLGCLITILITMPTLIPLPTRIESAESKPKVIEEYVGRVNTATPRHQRLPTCAVPKAGRSRARDSGSLTIPVVCGARCGCSINPAKLMCGRASRHRAPRRVGPLLDPILGGAQYIALACQPSPPTQSIATARISCLAFNSSYVGRRRYIPAF